MLQKNITNNINRFYWFKMLSLTGFMLPIAVLFWQENDLSMTKIMLLQSFFAILVVALEIPTGHLADMYGRKKTLIFGSLFSVFAFIIFSLSSSFWLFLLAEAFFALAISFKSGSDAALLYDTLKSLKRENEYQRIWGKAMSLSFLFIGITNIIGGFLGKIDFRIAIIAAVPFSLASFFVGLGFHEPERHKVIIEKNHLVHLFKAIKFALIKSKKLRWLIIYVGVIYAFYQSVLWLYQPYFSLIGLDIIHFGFVFASFQVVAAISAKYAHKIERFFGEKYSLVLLFVLVVMSYLLMGNFVYWFSFSFCFLHQFIRGFMKVVISDYVNKLIDSSMRATMLSVQNMFNSLLYALVIPIFGYLADVFSLTLTLTIIGLGAFVCGGSVLIMLYKKKII